MSIKMEHAVVETVERYLAGRNTTVREVADSMKISKSCVHHRLVYSVPKYCPEFQDVVNRHLALNKEERNIRGGNATKEKYKKLRYN